MIGGEAPARQIRGAHLIQRVVEVTLDQLARQGYRQLSIPEVALLAGVNKTSIYRRWPDKKDLVGAALAQTFGPGGTLPDLGSLEQDMLALALVAVRFAETPRGRAVLRIMLLEGEDPEVQELTAALRAAPSVQLPLRLLERALARGELPATCDVPLLLHSLAGAIFHRIMLEQSPITGDYLKRLIRLMLDGVRGSGSGRDPA